MTLIIYCNNYAVTELDQRVHNLIMGGYRLSTSQVYKFIQQGFISFCYQNNLSPLLLTEQLILWYIAFEAPTVGSRSCNVYLAAIKDLHICNYLPSTPPITPHVLN